jgi:2-methylisocitrate lyase-like PEP mutase family enzyme
MTKTQRMRQLIAAKKLCISPGVYDGYSVRLVESMGFDTASISGTGICNSRLGRVEETGIMSLLENVEACRHIAGCVSIPIMADADTGYGNAVTVYHTVQYFESAGIVGINIEDQDWPKRCGHLSGKEVIPPIEMAKKVEAARKAKRDPDFIINARTDAIAVEGFAAALARAKLYAKAGADMVYPEAVENEDQIRRMVEEVGVPIHINMGLGIRRRATNLPISLVRLEEIGVARVALPRMLSAAAIMGMKRAIEVFRDNAAKGEILDRDDLLVSFDEIMALMQYDRVQSLEREFLSPEALERKYAVE